MRNERLTHFPPPHFSASPARARAFFAAVFMLFCVVFIFLARAQSWGFSVFGVAVGVYGVVTIFHLTMELRFAAIDRRRVENLPKDFAFYKVGACVVGWNEDPVYFRDCLNSIKNLETKGHRLRVFVAIDGAAGEEGAEEMRAVFDEVFPNGKIFALNFLPSESGNDSQFDDFCLKVKKTEAPVCVMQPHKGKREAMYTAMRSIDCADCDYAMLIDSDTVVDKDALNRLLDIVTDNPATGAVTGNVGIFNRQSLLARIVNQRYWMAFNLERASQSYYGGVSCVSGAMGLYKVALLRQIIDRWANQRFLGAKCTYGDDRHLTNLVLSLGAPVYYTHLANCQTESPTRFNRWVVQQTRWTKSYWREFFLNMGWAHKQHPWLWWSMVYKALFTLLLIFVVVMFLSLQQAGVVALLLAAALFGGVLRMLFASRLTEKRNYSLFWLYGFVYIGGLMPGKLWALLTLPDTAWGTTRGMRHNFPGYVYGWLAMLAAGFWGSLAKAAGLNAPAEAAMARFVFPQDQSGQLWLMFAAFFAAMAAIKLGIALRESALALKKRG